MGGASAQSITEESQREITSRDESYALSVPGDGSSAVLTANSTLGLFRGLTTFEQLWYYFSGDIYTLDAPVEINDAPAYVRSFRCLLKDVSEQERSPIGDSCLIQQGTCRLLVFLFFAILFYELMLLTSFPVADIKRTLDAMSWVKVCFVMTLITTALSVFLDQYIPLARCR